MGQSMSTRIFLLKITLTKENVAFLWIVGGLLNTDFYEIKILKMRRLGTAAGIVFERVASAQTIVTRVI